MQPNRKRAEYYFNAENIDLLLKLHGAKAIKYYRKGKPAAPVKNHIGVQTYRNVETLH